MSSETPFITPFPKGPEAPVEAVAPRELIVMPPEIQQPSGEKQLQDEQALAERIAASAQRVISAVPGRETEVATKIDAEPGSISRFGLGVIPIETPADPSHVIGWSGKVKRP